MLLDVSCLFAQNLSLVDGVPTVLDMGEKGLGRVKGLNLFVEMSEAAAGLTSANFKLFLADDEEGAENKTEILATPEYTAAKMVKGFACQFEVPALDKRYLILEVDKTGTATAGKYWAGLTTAEQYAYHNRK